MPDGGGHKPYVFTKDEQHLINAVEWKLGLNYREHQMQHDYLKVLIDSDVVAYIQRKKLREDAWYNFLQGVGADVIRWTARGAVLLLFLSVAMSITDAWGVLFPGG